MALVDDALCDLYGHTINSMGILVNEEEVIPEGASNPVSITVTAAAQASSDPLLKPHDFTGTFNATIAGVPVQPGVNTITLYVINPYEHTGYSSHTFDIVATPPTNIVYDVQLALTESQSTGYELMLDVWYGPEGGALEQWATPSPLLPDPDDPTKYTGKFLGSLVEVGGMHSQTFDPAEPDTLVVDVWIENVMDELVIVTESANDSEVFEGVAELEDFERLTWEGYTFQVQPLHQSASNGGHFVPYVQEVVPPGMHVELTGVKVFSESNQVLPLREYLVQEYAGRSFLTLPLENTPSLITLLENQDSGDSFFMTLQSGDIEDILGDWGEYNLAFGKGNLTGLWDTGVALVDDIGTIAKGAWHLAWNYNQFAIRYRVIYHAVTGEGDGYILDEDERKLEAIGDFAVLVADIAFNVMQDHVDAAYALLTRDHEEFNRLGAEYQIVAEYLVEIFDAVRQEILNASAGELGHAAGWVTGRITGEVALEVVPALATGGASLSFRAVRVSGAVGKIATKFRNIANVVPNVPGLSPQLMTTIADKVEDMADYLGAMATTKMCFVAGTPVHTIEGLIPIEEVSAGDLVLSRDDETGSMGYKPVVQTFVTHPDVLYTLTYESDGPQCSGEGHESLTGTGEHPFFVVDTDDFVPMRELKIGDQLLLDDGISAAYVTDIQVQRGPPECDSFTTYNFEVADWHTYFVGGTASGGWGGVWVHNRGPACQRAFAMVERIARNSPGTSHWDAFVQLLNRTNSAGRRAAIDPVLPNVVADTMRKSFNDAVGPDGAVDLTKVKSWKAIDEFRFPANAPPDHVGRRLRHLDLENHHVFPKKYAEELLRELPQYAGLDDTAMKSLLDEMPGFLMNKHFHRDFGEGTAAFHSILRRRMQGVNPRDPDEVLTALHLSYIEWGDNVGEDVYKVAEAWIMSKGVM